MTISRTQTQRSRRIDVAPDLLSGEKSYDYADAFEIDLSRTDHRSPEQVFRHALRDASWLRGLVPIVHRAVLRFRLGTQRSPDRILGWRVAFSGDEVIRLEAEGPLMRGVIVGRRTATTAVLTTFLFYERAALARAIWTAVGPVHRRVAPYLLKRAAEGYAEVASDR
jgi:hypothetical protein